ncbi:hypothetical protein RKE29_10065 [Streptomyces sp. B1866]|uniref:SCO2584 family spore wall biosynthesis protein n=1 Tax=Streptomyces sp. B1866 TaxID=3075431 RepID=UPI00288E6BB9|nr:hypothetical protein [Streptomyces sp. B1866]MDT3396988.1 hypothetical protein [Streptomyces sp. B1866]
MPDDVGGRPFPDGPEPEEHSHGGADDAFASVVFDEDFVRAAEIHEPTATERMLAAAQARAEAEAARPRGAPAPADEEPFDDVFGPDGAFGLDPDDDRYPGPGFGRDPDAAYGPYGRYGSAGGPYRGHARWQRPVAWLLAVLMGIGVVALAFTAVYRGASGSRQEPSPPATPASSGVGAAPGAAPERPESPTAPTPTAPSASAVPHAP